METKYSRWGQHRKPFEINGSSNRSPVYRCPQLDEREMLLGPWEAPTGPYPRRIKTQTLNKPGRH